MRAGRRDWAFLVVLSLVWGAAFMATRVATEDFRPFTLAGLRLGLGALALGAVMLVEGTRLPLRRADGARAFWLYAFGVAVLSNAAPFVLLSWGQRHIDSALAGVAVTVVPLFVLPLAHLLVPGERLSWRKAVGFGIGFTGALVLIGWERLSSIGSGTALALIAQLACFGAAFGYASGSIVSKLAPPVSLVAFGAAALGMAALMVLPVGLLIEPWPDGGPGALPLLAILYLGLIPTALATVILLSVISSAGPSFLSLVNYMVPLWAVFFGWAVLDESIPWRLGPALGLILLGLAVSQNLIGLRRGGHARG